MFVKATWTNKAGALILCSHSQLSSGTLCPKPPSFKVQNHQKAFNMQSIYPSCFFKKNSPSVRDTYQGI